MLEKLSLTISRRYTIANIRFCSSTSHVWKCVTFDLDLGVKVIQNLVKYSHHHVTPAKSEGERSTGQKEMQSKYII